MQIKLFYVTAGDEAALAELNTFLRGQRVLGVAEEYDTRLGCWSYSVRYLTTSSPGPSAQKSSSPKKDYRQELSEETFAYFSDLRKTRKEMADLAAVPAYVVFTNEELAAIARLGRAATPEALLAIPGIGKGKAEKYGADLLNKTNAQ